MLGKLRKKESIIKILGLLLVIIIGLNMKNILAIVTGSETPIAVVRGYSMYPLLREGDLVFAYKPKPEDIHVGDIIIYKGLRGNLVIHRVIKIRVINGKYYYVTKGDNNLLPDYLEFTGPDKAGIPYDRVEGLVISINNSTLKIPYIGYLSIWYHSRR
ncbi:MAG: signal peptidase I [Desulfurococcales archaeon ex4484_58]|nr:MAG: signal peptidase I [Desulfurococcales archaeon ex4484_58]